MIGATLGTAGSGAATIARHISQVEDQFNGLDGAVCRLQALLDGIEERTVSIARQPEPCNVGASGGPPEEVLVPVADTIRCMARRIHSVNNRLESLLSRIEL